MFRKVMYNNEELCKNIIELLLDVDIDHIVYKDQEHSITATTDSKSVRLDVDNLASVASGRIFIVDRRKSFPE
ncbi:MAG: hypothetical protein IKE52_05455 [Mogibacterium sp.]|nr:hypothetical protein [Mogibacterium sp.]